MRPGRFLVYRHTELEVEVGVQLLLLFCGGMTMR